MSPINRLVVPRRHIFLVAAAAFGGMITAMLATLAITVPVMRAQASSQLDQQAKQFAQVMSNQQTGAAQKTDPATAPSGLPAKEQSTVNTPPTASTKVGFAIVATATISPQAKLPLVKMASAAVPVRHTAQKSAAVGNINHSMAANNTGTAIAATASISRDVSLAVSNSSNPKSNHHRQTQSDHGHKNGSQNYGHHSGHKTDCKTNDKHNHLSAR